MVEHKTGHCDECGKEWGFLEQIHGFIGWDSEGTSIRRYCEECWERVDLD